MLVSHQSTSTFGCPRQARRPTLLLPALLHTSMPSATAAVGHAALWARKLSFGSKPVLLMLPASDLVGGDVRHTATPG